MDLYVVHPVKRQDGCRRKTEFGAGGWRERNSMDRLREASNEAEECSGRSVLFVAVSGASECWRKSGRNAANCILGGDDFQGLGHSIGGCA